MLSVSIKKQLHSFTLDVEFEVKNEITVLFGPSGSGKTTILNTIAGIFHPDAGLIQLNDKIFYASTIQPLSIQKRNVGYLFQDYALFPHMTNKKNILYGVKSNNKSWDESFIKQLFDVMGIHHLLEKFPKQISGGEKQRVALARALATQPDILLLDEPFSALDELTKNECQQELIRLHDIWKIPIILVTHDPEVAHKLGNSILYLEKGKLQQNIHHSKKKDNSVFI